MVGWLFDMATVAMVFVVVVVAIAVEYPPILISGLYRESPGPGSKFYPPVPFHYQRQSAISSDSRASVRYRLIYPPLQRAAS